MRAELLHSMPAVALRAPVGVVIGDPCGVGPEVVAKAWVSGRLHAVCRPVLIGSAASMQQAIRIAGSTASVRVVRRALRHSGQQRRARHHRLRRTGAGRHHPWL